MSTTTNTHGPRRSKILVRGASRQELDAALASEVDIICVDLEDTVADQDKDAARRLTADLMASGTRAETSVRINAVSTAEGLQDLLMLREWKVRPALVVITKVCDPYEIRLAAQMLPGTELFAIIETAEGLEAAADIARASPALTALLLGGKDLSHSLGCERSWEGLHWARGRLVQAAALGGVHAHDEPYRPLDDLEGLEVTCKRVKAMGYKGKATVDLRHVPIINRIFS
ncbi:MAG: aldolase/citrate lyase family protein [Betaproteobacteria bacterium]